MRFEIQCTEKISRRIIKYNSEELSFKTTPIINEVDLDLIYNSIILTIVDKQVVQIWGYAGDIKWSNFALNIPAYKKGLLKITDELEYGFSYRINDNPAPIFHDINTGWICVGNPLADKQGVEFMKDCIAFIDLDGQLESLWIKPVYE